MKKSFVFILLILILTSFAISAEENKSLNLSSLNESLNLNSVNESIGKFKTSLNDRTENVLTREILIPNALQAPAKLIFGVDESISWQD